MTQNGPENYQLTCRLRWKEEEEQMLHLWRATRRDGGAGSSEGIRRGGRKATGGEKRALCGGGLPPLY